MIRFNRALAVVGDFLFPARCLGCMARIEADDVLCPRCIASLVALPADRDTSLMHLASLSVVTDARAMFVGFEYEHDSALAACIHAMKYRDLHRIGLWLGRLLGERLAGNDILRGDPLLVPVPLHRLKLLERGYNQSEFLCRGIADETGLTVVADGLVRRRYTRSQAACRLEKGARRGNVRGAFAVNPARAGMLLSRPVILADDLITTGSTIAECASTLVAHGACDVRFLAVARPAK